MEQSARIGDPVDGYSLDCLMATMIVVNFLANALATPVPPAVLETHGPSSQTNLVLTFMNGLSRD
jgi:hypothetical protein